MTLCLGMGCGGLDGGEYGSFRFRRLDCFDWSGSLLRPGFELLDKGGYEAGAGFGFGDLGGRGEGAEGGMDGDLFHGLFAWNCFPGGRGGAGEVKARDLEAVEEESGAAGVDVVAGDAAEDFADGALDGAAVLG
jgi:hypothetical protein